MCVLWMCAVTCRFGACIRYRVCIFAIACRCLQAEKILREAPDGTKIYVPIRNAPRMSFSDRFWKKVCRGSAHSVP